MRNKKKLCAGILMLLLLTGCSSQEVLQEVPQTIVLPESQIDTMPVQETAAAENDNTESFSLLEEGGSRFAYESLDAQEQIWYQEIEQAIGSMDDTIKLSTEPLEQGMDDQDIDKGLAMLTECADSGDTCACYKLGKIYFKGEIVLQDLDKAEKYLLLAEDNEFTQYALGKLYLQKEKYDVQKAVDYFEKSADKNMWSSYQLGRLYLFGAEGLEKDKTKAVEWLTKSANDGNEYAQNMLNNMAQFENAVIANTIFSLFANLSRCIEDDYTQKYKAVRRTVDSKLRRMIHRKKQSLGIKDDQEQQFNY